MLTLKAEIILRGHILNPLWASRSRRRTIRGRAIQDAVGRYLDKYAAFAATLAPQTAATPQTTAAAVQAPHAPQVPDTTQPTEKIFSIWLQGEKAAPKVVQACWKSVRANCNKELVILDSNTIFDWISLPEIIVEKWKNGMMRPAHFADICRLELLYSYGGVWVDATDFVAQEFPKWLQDSDFFVYMSGSTLKGWYSYVQNCFIRAKKGNFLVGAWRDMLVEYWSHENKAVDYFVHQLLFKKLVESNAEAAQQFEEMPKISQDPTHAVWFGKGAEKFDEKEWNEMTEAALFQKTEFKSELAQRPPKGSFAEHLLSF